MTRSRLASKVFPVVLLMLGLSVPIWIENKFYMHLFIMILFYAALSGSWNILAGYAGQLSLGHAAFFGIGAYTSTLLLVKAGISPWIGMLAAMVLCMIVGAGIGYPCFRLKGPFFTLATLAFAEVIRLIAVFWRGLTNGAMGINIPFRPGWATMMFRGKEEYYYIALAMCLLVIGITFWIERSKIGSYLVAIREDEEAAQALGIAVSRYKLYAVLLSSALAGMTGVFYAQYILFIEPESVFHVNVSTQVALIAIIGGMGTLFGPLLGAALVVPLNELLRSALSVMNGLNFFIYGVALVLVVMWIPQGILPGFQTLIRRQQLKRGTD